MSPKQSKSGERQDQPEKTNSMTDTTQEAVIRPEKSKKSTRSKRQGRINKILGSDKQKPQPGKRR